MADTRRLDREALTVRLMIETYCRAHHRERGTLCDSCEDLRAFALARLRGCPFQDGKPVCARCAVHCYGKQMRERIREVMRYSGPRMMLSHPLLAVHHMFDSLKAVPEGRSARGG